MVDVVRPNGLEEALIALQNGGTVLAGGTDLMVKRRSAPGALPHITGNVVMIGHLDELRRISISGFRLTLGSAASVSSVIENNVVPEHIKEPLRWIGSPSIRNMATLGGNIMNASPAGDSLTMLYALDAELTLRSVRGQRRLGIGELILAPGRTSLAEDELLCEISLPLEPISGFYYKKAGQRRANAIAKVSLYGAYVVNKGRVISLRMAFGAVGPTVVRERSAELIAEGCLLSELRQRKPDIIQRLDDVIKPIDDLRSSMLYRKKVAMNLADAFIEEVARN